MRRNSLIEIDPPFQTFDKPVEHVKFEVSLRHRKTLTGRQSFTTDIHIIDIFRDINSSELDGLVFRRVSDILRSSLGAVMMGNWGLHASKTNYEGVLDHLFSWAQSDNFLLNPNKSNAFFYRETSSQHFPMSPFGLYGGRDKHSTTCAPIDPKHFTPEEGDPSTGRSWMSVSEDKVMAQAERRAEQQREQGEGEGQEHMRNNRIVRVLFRDISSLYHSLHYSSEMNRDRLSFPAGYSDCTHICGVPPVLWYYLWSQVAQHPSALALGVEESEVS
jgi:hypothetical protein